MGPPMFGIGMALIFGGVVGFVLDNVGPRSKLWWPDRPQAYDRAARIPGIMIGLGIVLAITGLIIG